LDPIVAKDVINIVNINSIFRSTGRDAKGMYGSSPCQRITLIVRVAVVIISLLFTAIDSKIKQAFSPQSLCAQHKSSTNIAEKKL